MKELRKRPGGISSANICYGLASMFETIEVNAKQWVIGKVQRNYSAEARLKGASSWPLASCLICTPYDAQGGHRKLKRH